MKRRSPVTFGENSFRECVSRDADLAALRAEYSRKSAEARRRAADCEYHSAIASRVFNNALAHAGPAGWGEQRWPEGILALAIDPLFVPAILTVGSMEYQLGREDEAMALFGTFATLPAEEPDLPIIIDKAAEFLLDAGDYERARDLYVAAEKAFPKVAVYPAGLSYCLGKLGLYEEAVAKARRADALEPDNYVHLNDLGWALYQTGCLNQAEEMLGRSVELAPDDFELAFNNLAAVREALRGTRPRRGQEKP